MFQVGEVAWHLRMFKVSGGDCCMVTCACFRWPGEIAGHLCMFQAAGGDCWIPVHVLGGQRWLLDTYSCFKRPGRLLQARALLLLRVGKIVEGRWECLTCCWAGGDGRHAWPMGGWVQFAWDVRFAQCMVRQSVPCWKGSQSRLQSPVSDWRCRRVGL